MARKYLEKFLLILLLHSKYARAIPWQEASSTLAIIPTSVTTALSSSASSPTPTPTSRIWNDGPLEPQGVCGYVNHDHQNPYTCAFFQTCLWNKNLRLLGCGSPPSLPPIYYTSCIPYNYRPATALSSSCSGSGNSTCLSDPSILYCPSAVPHCATAHVGGSNGSGSERYMIRACQAIPPLGKIKVGLEYKGQSVLGHLPRWLGKDGIVSYGVVTPEVAGASNTGPGSGGFNPATIPGGVFTVVFNSGGNERYRTQVRRMVLAGGLVGGLAMVFEVGAAGWWTWAWRKKEKMNVVAQGGGGFTMRDLG